MDCGAFVLQARPRKPEEAAGRPLLGVIASRRVGNAVVRNRGKRLMREVFRKHQGELPEGCAVVIVLRSAYARYDYAELEARFRRACGKLERYLANRESDADTNA